MINSERKLQIPFKHSLNNLHRIRWCSGGGYISDFIHLSFIEILQGWGIEQSCHRWSAAWLRWHQSYLLSQIIMLVPFYNQESQQTDIKEINSYSVYTTSSRCTLTEFRINAFLISLTCKLTVCQVNALRRKRQMLLVQLLALLT